MYTPFASVCDDFYVNMRLATQLSLPHNRETVLHFFERVQRQFPEMSRFRKYDNGDLSIEENRDNDAYRWVTLESRRLCAGHVNPESLEDSLKLHSLLLQQVPYDSTSSLALTSASAATTTRSSPKASCRIPRSPVFSLSRAPRPSIFSPASPSPSPKTAASRAASTSSPAPTATRFAPATTPTTSSAST